MDVLLSGSMGDLARIARENLESHGLEVEIFDIPQNTFRDEFGYHRGLMKAISRCQPRMVIPIGNQIALSRYRLPEGVVAPIECEEKLRRLESKLGATSLARDLGIRQPQFYTRDDVPEGRQMVFKRDISFGGHGVHLPWDMKALDNLISREKPGTFLIQDYIEGDDYCVDAVRWNHGGYFRAGSYKVLEHRGNGPSTARESVSYLQIEQTARLIMDAVDYNGVCGFDFRVSSDDGLPYFLECNPRFSGGLQTQIDSGFEIPFILWELGTAPSKTTS